MIQINIAKKFIGQKELPSNVFDYNSELGRLLKLSGHKNGEAWCCYFQEGIFCEAYPNKQSTFRKLFSASCVKTFENFKDSGYLISKQPVIGYLTIWRRYKNNIATYQGHAGLCIEVGKDTFKTIEGNTNSKGSREGDSVQEKTHLIKQQEPENGLRLLGFINVC